MFHMWLNFYNLSILQDYTFHRSHDLKSTDLMSRIQSNELEKDNLNILEDHIFYRLKHLKRNRLINHNASIHCNFDISNNFLHYIVGRFHYPRSNPVLNCTSHKCWHPSNPNNPLDYKVRKDRF